MLTIGQWRVDERSGDIARGAERARLDARTLRVLLCLAEHAGEIVSSESLLNAAWGDVAVSQDSVYQAVASLRRLLGDDPKSPSYIETVPRLGYRLIAAVQREAASQPAADSSRMPSAPAPRPSNRSRGIAVLGAVLLLGAAVIFWLLHSRSGKIGATPAHASDTAPARSLAVVPLLDLTEGMKDEEFADGITEELIDKISKIPNLQVTPPTSSFYFKDKNVQVAEIAKSLRVSYVLDGSLRKSGDWIRVDVRLIRANSGFVVWSETYDQPKSDLLTIQDDIARKVAESLRLSLPNSASP
ncbi:winged helix-turn-helix domain-containing protein [Occallatibacter riparius]|uniref:Winged helix-turn-helix domain-containing protein n=1 Tax=Occallatibacter riparius TaxID=1002689 RepID=A0A9J7BKY2_9BACT|nr:winged helix-turn-helix domain-containing protein [Occallatibacter riparius]UWZ82426.1 winged helix-turn-helix domain-containing protein [Occallatibacter riparius]